MKNRYTSQDIFTDTHRKIEALNTNNRSLQKQMKMPTVPAYRIDTWPDKATYGQIVQDLENSGMLWIYAEDDRWWPIGGFTRCVARVINGGYGTQFIGQRDGVKFDWGGSTNEFINWDQMLIRPNDWTIFDWTWDSYDRPPAYPAREFIIQRGGVYRTTWQIFMEHVGDPSNPVWQAAPGITEYYEPDWNGWTGMDFYYPDFVGRNVRAEVTFTISYDVLNGWGSAGAPPVGQVPPGSRGPREEQGIYQILDVYVADADPNAGEVLWMIDAPPTSFNGKGSLQGCWQGTYMEILRLGDAPILDLFFGGVPYAHDDATDIINLADSTLPPDPLSDEDAYGNPWPNPHPLPEIKDAPIVRAMLEADPMNAVGNAAEKIVEQNTQTAGREKGRSPKPGHPKNRRKRLGIGDRPKPERWHDHLEKASNRIRRWEE
jgi:hypothetical protein